MQISCSHPWFLLLLPPLLAGTWYVARRGLSDLRGARAAWSMGLRMAILTLAVLALAGLQVRQPTKRLAVLFVLDQSESIPSLQREQAIDYVNEAARRMKSNDLAGVVVFGTNAYLERDPRPALRLRQVHSLPGRDYSNLAGAVRLALSAFPDDAQRRIVLLSDGNQNLGDVVEEAAGASSSQVQIDSVPIVYDYPKEVLLDKMVVPGEAKVGEPFEVRVIARSKVAQRAVIRLLRNGELIAQQAVSLLPGPNVVTFQQSLEQARFHTYDALIEGAEDTLAENNRALGFVLVRGKPRVLVVESDPSEARFLAAALRTQKLEVDVRAPGQLPATLAEFQTYDSVVLSNVGAFQLTPDQMKAIRSSVRDLGSGLVMVGGPNSFGPGAYRGTPIEEALPVEMEVKKQKVMPVGAVAMILHTCEFPDGNRWAAETAAAVVDVLGERDFVGVIDYGMRGEEWGIQLQRANNKEQIKNDIYNLNPGDAPDFHSMMKMAHDGLTSVSREAAVKHMIIISDGDPSPPSQQLLANIRRARITVSTVAVFPHGSGTGTLENIAREGRGRFYNVRRPDEIPRIFLKEAQRVLKPAIIEERFTPRMLPESQLLSGIEGVPPLLGYVAATPKQAPSVEVAMSSPRGDPVLVSWRFGLGKAVAFTSDAKNRWAAAWLTGGDTFARFWAQTVRWTVRSTARSELDVQVELGQRKGRVAVDAVDSRGEFLNMLDIRGSVAATTTSPTLRIDQTAPGRYEGEFEAPEKGQYMVAVRYTDPAGIPRSQMVGVAIPYSPEFRDLTANTTVLTNVAERTGGKVYPALGPEPHPEHLAAIWRHDRRANRAPADLWAALLLTAALLLPVDIGVRRLAIGRSEMAAMMAVVAGVLFGRLRTRRERARGEERAGLFTAKERARRRMAGGPEPVVSEPSAPPATPPAAPSAAPSPSAPGPSAARPAPSVIWNRPVEGVTSAPSPPPTPRPGAPPAAAAPPQPSVAPEEETTSRLLRARRRAREKQE